MHGSLLPFFEDPLLLDCKALSQASKAISGPFRKINFITDDLFPFGLVAKLAGEQGCRSGESTHLPPIWFGFESWRQPHMWVEFVVGSLPCSERFFSGYSGFPLSLKTNTYFQIPNRSGTHGHVSTSSHELLSAPWVNKLQNYIYNYDCSNKIRKLRI